MSMDFTYSACYPKGKDYSVNPGVIRAFAGTHIAADHAADRRTA